MFNTCTSPWACDYITVTVKGKVKDMLGVTHSPLRHIVL